MMIESKGRVAAIILAGGSGQRFSRKITKQKYELLGKTVLYRACMAFERTDAVDDIIVVCNKDELEFATAETAHLKKLRAVVRGGFCRADSARLGFFALGEDYQGIVMIHDAARCLVSIADVNLVLDLAAKSGAATAARPIKDTVKLADSGVIIKTLSRDNIITVQTPQAFDAELYKRALDAIEPTATITDDNMLIEMLGERVAYAVTSAENIKITTPDDLLFAEYIIRRREGML